MSLSSLESELELSFFTTFGATGILNFYFIHLNFVIFLFEDLKNVPFCAGVAGAFFFGSSSSELLSSELLSFLATTFFGIMV